MDNDEQILMFKRLREEPCTVEKFSYIEAVINDPDATDFTLAGAIHGLNNCGSKAWPLLRPILNRPNTASVGSAITILTLTKDEVSYSRIFDFLAPDFSLAQDNALWAVLKLQAFDQINKVVNLLGFYAAPVRDMAWVVIRGLCGLQPLDQGEIIRRPEAMPQARIECLNCWPQFALESFQRARGTLDPRTARGTEHDPVLLAYRRAYAIKYSWEMCDRLATFVVACLKMNDPVHEIANLEPWHRLIDELRQDTSSRREGGRVETRTPDQIIDQLVIAAEGGN